MGQLLTAGIVSGDSLSGVVGTAAASATRVAMIITLSCMVSAVNVDIYKVSLWTWIY
jgi:hypothetical protein